MLAWINHDLPQIKIVADLLAEHAAAGLADGDHHRHRNDADDHSKQSQSSAQTMRQKRVPSCSRSFEKVLPRSAPVGASNGRPLSFRLRRASIGRGFRGAIGHDDAVGEFNDPLRLRRNVVVMRREDDRMSLAIEIDQKIHDLAPIGAVQRAGRLVGEDRRAFIHQRPCDRNPLLLPSRQLIGIMRQAIAEPQAPEQRLSAGLAQIRRDFGVNCGRLDIGESGELTEQIVTLKDESEMLAPQLRERVGVEPRRVASRHAVGSGAQTIETAQNIEQRRLAGAGSAHQRDHFAGVDDEINAVERHHALIARAIAANRAAAAR